MAIYGFLSSTHRSIENLAHRLDALTCTYLLRYVDDVAAKLARVVRPGGRIEMIELGAPSRPGPRTPWRWHTRIELPPLGRVVSAACLEVGRFLGPSIEEFHSREPDLKGRWRAAGIGQVQSRQMSFGAGLVMAGVRAVNA